MKNEQFGQWLSFSDNAVISGWRGESIGRGANQHVVMPRLTRHPAFCGQRRKAGPRIKSGVTKKRIGFTQGRRDLVHAETRRHGDRVAACRPSPSLRLCAKIFSATPRLRVNR
ncbi:hypothetical protein SC1_03201 [Sphingopyxis sp. C-1]|nr:hypothetical protein SC1_03201 [Sphingopyxis sp. C-1]